MTNSSHKERIYNLQQKNTVQKRLRIHDICPQLLTMRRPGEWSTFSGRWQIIRPAHCLIDSKVGVMSCHTLHLPLDLWMEAFDSILIYKHLDKKTKSPVEFLRICLSNWHSQDHERFKYSSCHLVTLYISQNIQTHPFRFFLFYL